MVLFRRGMSIHKICFSGGNKKQLSVRQLSSKALPYLFDLEFYSTVNTVNVMLSRSVNLFTVFWEDINK